MVPLDQELLVMLEEKAEMEEAKRRERRESRRRQEERQEPGLVLESSESKENYLQRRQRRVGADQGWLVSQRRRVECG